MAVGGNKRGTYSVDWQVSRSAASQVASGGFAVIGGGRSNEVSGSSYGVIGGGRFNVASGQASVIAGGQFNTVISADSTIAGGTDNTVSGPYATVGGGAGNIADGANSVVPGGWNATTRGLNGRMSFATGQFSLLGDSQYGLHVLRRETTNATLTGLGAGGTAPHSNNIPILPNRGLYAFRIQVSCIQTGGTAGAAGDCKAWNVVGAIKRGANAAATALLGTPTITVLGADANLGATNETGAIITITANTTLGGLVINVTGEANKNLRWVATVETTEVSY
jgi:hypothetical protein